MYRLMKDKGIYENVYLKNTDTAGEVNLGRPVTTILAILRVKELKDLDPYEKWNITVSEETKERLLATAMPIKKPKRVKTTPTAPTAPTTDTTTTSTATTPTNKNGKPLVDLLDIIYGLA